MRNPDRELANTLVSTIECLLEGARDTLKDLVDDACDVPVDITELQAQAAHINTLIELREIIDQGHTAHLDETRFKEKLIEVIQFQLEMEN